MKPTTTAPNANLKSRYRTYVCNVPNKTNINEEIYVSGWVHSIRDHGGLVFVDLRDNYGLIQLVADKEHNATVVDQISALSPESVITAFGKVVKRKDDTDNKDIPTGEIEVELKTIEVHSKAKVLPFEVCEDTDYNEEIRLKYRFLDLRRKKLHHNMLLRSQVVSYIRKTMEDAGFFEFSTPILTAASPEGARDFLVPSRLNPGKFYALPQAPQQFKQLLMISGFDRYFQIAPCFRDENARADRSPGEFYQLDIEMSFVEQEDILQTMEPIIAGIFEKFGKGRTATSPFPRIPYAESMLKYGSDKPDLRNPIENSNPTEAFKGSGFGIFAGAIEKGATIRGIPAPKACTMPRSFFDDMISFAQKNGAKGLAYIIFDESGIAKGPIAKLLTDEELGKVKSICNVGAGDAVFFSCGDEHSANKIAGLVRNEIARKLDIVEKDCFKLCWIVDFPYFEMNENKPVNPNKPNQSKIDFAHNPFSMPNGGIEALKTNDEKELLALTAQQYDIVCNGIELSSGAVRNHKPDIMYRAFEIVGYTAQEVDKEFGGMMEAFKFGAPPHGGIAPGIERILMMLCDAENIRDVVAFPLNGNAQDLLMNAPSEVPETSLRELRILTQDDHKTKLKQAVQNAANAAKMRAENTTKA